MIGVREHVDRLDFPYGVAMMNQKPQVPFLRFGIAGDINNPFWGKRAKRG